MLIETKTDTVAVINAEIDNSTTPGTVTLDQAEWDDFYKYILNVHGVNKEAYNHVKKDLDEGFYSYRGFDIIRGA